MAIAVLSLPLAAQCDAGFEQQVLFSQDFEAPIGDAAYTNYGFAGGAVAIGDIGGGDASISALSGAANYFVGLGMATGNTLPTTDLSQVYMTADITVNAGPAFTFPVNLDFKLEDPASDPGTGSNLLNFLTPLTANGTFSIGGSLDGAINSGFQFAGATTVVIAVADFSGNGMTDNIEVIVDNVQLYACVPATGCAITVAALGDPSPCAANNTFDQTIEIIYDNAPAGGFLIVDGGAVPVTGSPQQVNLSGLVANGQEVSINVFFTDEISCAGTGTFTAPESCFEAPVACPEGEGVAAVYSQDFSALPGDPAYIPFGESFGGGSVFPWNTGGGQGELTIANGTADFFVGFALPTGIMLPSNDLSEVYMTAEITVVADGGFAFPINMDFKVEDASSDANSGANLLNFLTPLTGNGTYQIGGVLSSATNTGFQFNGPVSIIAAVASFGAGPTSGGLTVFVDNIQLYTCQEVLYLCRQGALYGDVPGADGNEIYTWFLDGTEVATFTGINMYSPLAPGAYSLSVTDPDSGMMYVFEPRNVTDITGCCELDDPCAQPE